MIKFLNKGINTSDATATANDILAPKTAYVNSEKITGTIQKEYESADLATGTAITNSSGSNIFDVHYPSKLALAGTLNATSFKICSIENDVISTLETISISTISNLYNYQLKDLKFDYDGYEDNQIRFYGCCNLDNSNGTTRRMRRLLFVIDYDLSTHTWKEFHYDYTDSYYLNISSQDSTMNDSLVLFGKNLVAVKPSKLGLGYNYNGAVAGTGVYPTTFFSISNNTILKLGTYKRTGNEPFSANATNAFASEKLYIEYNNSSYVVYKNQNYSFTTLVSGSNNATNRVALIGDSNYLIGNILYDLDGKQVATLDKLTSSLYKLYSNGYIYQFNLSAKQVTIFKIDLDTFTIEEKQTLNNSNSSYTIDNPYVTSKPISSNLGVVYGSSSIYNAYREEVFNIKSLTRDAIKYINTIDGTVTPETMLEGYVAYSKDKKIVGKMPNNGTLNYTPSTEEQIIPKGYTTGGTIAAVDSSIDSNILAENIKAGINILGVTGTLQEKVEEYVLDVTDNSSISIEGNTLIIGGEE